MQYSQDTATRDSDRQNQGQAKTFKKLDTYTYKIHQKLVAES